MATPREVLALCREKDVKAVDLRFVDLLGAWQRFTIPVSKLDEDVFENGLGLDGSAVRGWQSTHESDLLAVPQPETARLDPCQQRATLLLICDIQDPVTRLPYSRDPRHIARKAAGFLASSGLADVALWGLEVEFFVFDEFSVLDESRFERSSNIGFRKVDKGEVLSVDRTVGLYSTMAQALVDGGLDVGSHRRRTSATGQAAVELRHHELVASADSLMFGRYLIKKVADQHGRRATFLPKPLFGQRGSGLHTNVSLWKDQQPLFAGSHYAGLSEIALHAVGGLLRHAPGLMALTNPTTNSYKRLVPGFAAPVCLAYSQRNRSAACRVPAAGADPKARRIELRCPDPSCNPYLAFSGILMAMIDGILNKISPGEPLDCDHSDLSSDRIAEHPPVPDSLEAALAALAEDHDYLLRGDVFTRDVIETWIECKLLHEVEPLRQRPHPYELRMYRDV